MALMQNEEGAALEEKIKSEREDRGGRERERKASDTEWGALRCGERIIQKPWVWMTVNTWMTETGRGGGLCVCVCGSGWQFSGPRCYSERWVNIATRCFEGYAVYSSATCYIVSSTTDMFDLWYTSCIKKLRQCIIKYLSSKQWKWGRQRGTQGVWKGKISIRSAPLRELGSCLVSERVTYRAIRHACKSIKGYRARERRNVYLTFTVFSFPVCSIRRGSLKPASRSERTHSLFFSLLPATQTQQSAPPINILMGFFSPLIQYFAHDFSLFSVHVIVVF